MRIQSLLLFLSTVTAADALAFNVFSAFEAHPGLQQLKQTDQGAKFSVRMDIGKNENEAHLNLDGLGLELLQTVVPKSDRVGLPGADGPHPKTSTGALALNVLSTPCFIDMFGTQKVRFEKGAWEVIWKKDQRCGALICGFQLPAGAKRNANSAELPAGRVYLSFPIWTEDGLASRRSEKREAEIKCKEYNEEKLDEIKKFEEASNLFMKAMHYRNAVAAVEKIDLSGIRSMDHIPGDSDVLPVGRGFLMNTKGTVWNKENNFIGSRHTNFGEAFLTPIVEDSKDVLRP